jgi:23S rRNA (adenine2030-N6)-methyltransferase
LTFRSSDPVRCAEAVIDRVGRDIALAPARSDGTLPALPLGTEMTEVEQAPRWVLPPPVDRLQHLRPMLARMNYRHAYHAGSFADVLKHTMLALVIEHLKRKETAFRVIDTHAGAGRYSLGSAEAGKTGEWLGGIARLLATDAAPLPPDVAHRLAPYLDIVRRENGRGPLTRYPGSPIIALALMRSQDVLIATELHPEDRAALEAAIGTDRRAKVMGIDAWVALKSLLPPKERRGVVLIDPPFEAPDEFDRIALGLAQAVRRFATGTYLIWYPIKDPIRVKRFHARLVELGPLRLLRVELMIQRPVNTERLNGCGIVVVNPPHTLEGDMAAVLPDLARRLSGAGSGAGYRLDWMARAQARIPRGPSGMKGRMRSSR